MSKKCKTQIAERKMTKTRDRATTEHKDKPKIYLAVILPILLLGSLAIALSLIDLYARIKGIPRPGPIRGISGILITLPALFLWIPIALLLANFVLYFVPPLRRIAERYAARSERPGFWESQRALLMMAIILAIICIPLICLGFWL